MDKISWLVVLAMTNPTISNIIAVVRQAGQEGCTAEYLARFFHSVVQPIRAALDLQVQAGGMSVDGKVYRIKEVKP